MFSPFLRSRSAGDRRRVHPAAPHDDRRHLGCGHDSGELTYMNLVHLAGVDGTDPDDLRGEIEGRRQAMLAIEALRGTCRAARTRAAQLRDDDRHPRHAQDRRSVQHDRGRRPRPGPVRRLDRDLSGVHRRLRHPRAADDGAIFPAAVPNVVPQRVRICSSRPLIGGDRVSHAATRNMSCCAVVGQGAGTAAAVSLKTGQVVRRTRRRDWCRQS